MTVRDRRLLAVALTALAAVIALRWLVLPAMEEKSALEDRLRTLTRETQTRESRLHALTYLDEAAAAHASELSAAAAPYAAYRTTEEMDTVLTGLLLKHGLFPRSMTLTEGQSGIPTAYLMPEKKKTAKKAPYDGVPLAELARREDVTAEEIAEKGSRYFYTASASFTAEGSAQQWLAFLDEVSRDHPDLRVTSFALAENGTSVSAAVEFCMREGE